MDTWKQTFIFHYIKTHLLYNNLPSVICSNLFYLNLPFNLLYIKEGCFSFSTIDIRGWTVLCCVSMVECLAASLASTHRIPIAPPPQVWQTKMSPDIAKCLQLRTIKELFSQYAYNNVDKTWVLRYLILNFVIFCEILAWFLYHMKRVYLGS